MSEVASAEQAELTGEIRKLSSYLEGVPPALRERGLFEAYETRLQDLEEQLVALRLSSILPRQPSAPDAPPASVWGNLSAWVLHLAEVEREHRRAADRLARRERLTHAAIGALSVGVAALAYSSPPHTTAAVASAVALLTFAEVLTRPADRVRKEQESALRAEMLRRELETLERQARTADGATPGENTALDGWTRRKILHLLDEDVSAHTKG